MFATPDLPFPYFCPAGVAHSLASATRQRCRQVKGQQKLSRCHGETEQQAAARDAAGPPGEHGVLRPRAAGVVQGTHGHDTESAAGSCCRFGLVFFLVCSVFRSFPFFLINHNQFLCPC